MTAGEIAQPGAEHDQSRAAALQQADSTGLEKVSEVTVFAIPLFHQGDLVQLVYLPVPTKDVPSDGKSRVPQKLLDYAQKTQVRQSVACRSVRSFLQARQMQGGSATSTLDAVLGQVHQHVATVGCAR